MSMSSGSEARPPAPLCQAKAPLVPDITPKPSSLWGSQRFTICLKCFLFPRLFLPLAHQHQPFPVGPPEGARLERGHRGAREVDVQQSVLRDTNPGVQRDSTHPEKSLPSHVTEVTHRYSQQLVPDEDYRPQLWVQTGQWKYRSGQEIEAHRAQIQIEQ